MNRTIAEAERSLKFGLLNELWIGTTPLFGLVALITYLLWLSTSSAPAVKAPTAGLRFSFEPTFLLRFRFITNAASIMSDGYNKFKNNCFVIKRMDTDLTIVPPKYLDELRTISEERLNATHANIHNMTGQYTNLSSMIVNNQFVRVIQDFLNPNINEFLKEMQAELDFAFGIDLPTHIDHTISIFATTLTLRMFPPALHPVLSLLIPRRWKIWSNIRESNKILRPIIEEYRAELENGSKPRTLLHWMIQNATEAQSTVEALVLSQLSVAVASVYTSSQVTSHLLFDLATHPEYIELLRKEVRERAPDLAKIDPNKLPLLDACLTETLRRNPPLLNAPNRRALQEIELKDGVVIPKGAMIAFPCYASSMDPKIYPDPYQYQPFREINKFSSVVTPNKNKLAFGWGTQACPGRFFAAKEIKIFVARLVAEFDFKVIPGTENQRRSFDLEDYRVLNPKMKLLMRRLHNGTLVP